VIVHEHRPLDQGDALFYSGANIRNGHPSSTPNV
jgi:hypothetical protein